MSLLTTMSLFTECSHALHLLKPPGVLEIFASASSTPAPPCRTQTMPLYPSTPDQKACNANRMNSTPPRIPTTRSFT